MSASTEIKIKERPILFSAPMVRAILEGRKTQTRRMAKFVPLKENAGLDISCPSLMLGDYFTGHPETGKVLYSMGGSCWQTRTERLFCPYGQRGDRLWVRETFSIQPQSSISSRDLLLYRADVGNTYLDGSWKPAIFLPRWASRITLEITDVRVQRLQEISEEDADSEGVALQSWTSNPDWPRTAGFAELWDFINAKRGFGWDINPWVWAISFKRVN